MKKIDLQNKPGTGGSKGAFADAVYSWKMTETTAGMSGKLIYGHSIEKLTEAGKLADRAGLTKAGRALAKHGGREGSVFPKPYGNSEQINLQGQKILEEILNSSQKMISFDTSQRFGDFFDIQIPNKGGVRYSVEGEFITFLEP